MIFERNVYFIQQDIRQQVIFHAMLSVNKHRPMMGKNLHTRHAMCIYLQVLHGHDRIQRNHVLFINVH